MELLNVEPKLPLRIIVKETTFSNPQNFVIAQKGDVLRGTSTDIKDPAGSWMNQGVGGEGNTIDLHLEIIDSTNSRIGVDQEELLHKELQAESFPNDLEDILNVESFIDEGIDPKSNFDPSILLDPLLMDTEPTKHDDLNGNHCFTLDSPKPIATPTDSKATTDRMKNINNSNEHEKCPREAKPSILNPKSKRVQSQSQYSPYCTERLIRDKQDESIIQCILSPQYEEQHNNPKHTSCGESKWSPEFERPMFCEDNSATIIRSSKMCWENKMNMMHQNDAQHLKVPFGAEESNVKTMQQDLQTHRSNYTAHQNNQNKLTSCHSKKEYASATNSAKSCMKQKQYSYPSNGISNGRSSEVCDMGNSHLYGHSNNQVIHPQYHPNQHEKGNSNTIKQRNCNIAGKNDQTVHITQLNCDSFTTCNKTTHYGKSALSKHKVLVPPQLHGRNSCRESKLKWFTDSETLHTKKGMLDMNQKDFTNSASYFEQMQCAHRTPQTREEDGSKWIARFDGRKYVEQKEMNNFATQKVEPHAPAQTSEFLHDFTIYTGAEKVQHGFVPSKVPHHVDDNTLGRKMLEKGTSQIASTNQKGIARNRTKKSTTTIKSPRHVVQSNNKKRSSTQELNDAKRRCSKEIYIPVKACLLYSKFGKIMSHKIVDEVNCTSTRDRYDKLLGKNKILVVSKKTDMVIPFSQGCATLSFRIMETSGAHNRNKFSIHVEPDFERADEKVRLLMMDLFCMSGPSRPLSEEETERKSDIVKPWCKIESKPINHMNVLGCSKKQIHELNPGKRVNMRRIIPNFSHSIHEDSCSVPISVISKVNKKSGSKIESLLNHELNNAIHGLLSTFSDKKTAATRINHVVKNNCLKNGIKPTDDNVKGKSSQFISKREFGWPSKKQTSKLGTCNMRGEDITMLLKECVDLKDAILFMIKRKNSGC